MLRPLLAAVLIALAAPLSAAEVRELNWSDMVPADAPAQVAEPAPIHDLSQLADALSEAGPASQQQSPAAPVVKELDGQAVKLPGYIVPLDVTDEGRVTEFLLVPYFGACIHVPPPPANQIVLVNAERGVEIDSLFAPVRVTGRMRVEAASTDLADAGYTLDLTALEKIDDF